MCYGDRGDGFHGLDGEGDAVVEACEDIGETREDEGSWEGDAGCGGKGDEKGEESADVAERAGDFGERGGEEGVGVVVGGGEEGLFEVVEGCEETGARVGWREEGSHGELTRNLREKFSSRGQGDRCSPESENHHLDV